MKRALATALVFRPRPSHSPPSLPLGLSRSNAFDADTANRTRPSEAQHSFSFCQQTFTTPRSSSFPSFSMHPDKDNMNSPSTAIVEANVNGRPIIVDFLHDIIGVKREEFRDGVTTIMLRNEHARP